MENNFKKAFFKARNQSDHMTSVIAIRICEVIKKLMTKINLSY